MELDQNFQFLVVALVYMVWRLTSDMSDVTRKVGNIFCPLEKKVKTSKTEKRLVKMVSENNFYNSTSKLMKQNLLVGVILDQNCTQILDATLNDFFFSSKTCFIKSSLNMPRT